MSHNVINAARYGRRRIHTAVGDFLYTSGTSQIVVTHNMGVVPKYIMLMSTVRPGTPSWDDNFVSSIERQGWGHARLVDGLPTHQGSMASTHRTGSSSSNRTNSLFMAGNSVFTYVSEGQTTVTDFRLVSANDTTFTLQPAGSTGATGAYRIAFLMLGGDNVDVQPMEFSLPSLTNPFTVNIPALELPLRAIVSLNAVGSVGYAGGKNWGDGRSRVGSDYTGPMQGFACADGTVWGQARGINADTPATHQNTQAPYLNAIASHNSTQGGGLRINSWQEDGVTLQGDYGGSLAAPGDDQFLNLAIGTRFPYSIQGHWKRGRAGSPVIDFEPPGRFQAALAMPVDPFSNGENIPTERIGSRQDSFFGWGMQYQNPDNWSEVTRFSGTFGFIGNGTGRGAVSSRSSDHFMRVKRPHDSVRILDTLDSAHDEAAFEWALTKLGEPAYFGYNYPIWYFY